MKWILILIIGLSICSNILSQKEWFPEGSEAYYSYTSIFDPNVFYARTFPLKDTIIEDKEARILVTNFTFFDHMDEEKLYERIIIHQDGNKIYRWIDGKFRILYDFDLEIGDTISIYVPGYDYGIDTLAHLRLDSISTLVVNGEEFKSQFLRPLFIGAEAYAFQFSGWAYETFGSLQYFIPIWQLLCDHWCTWHLRCYSAGDVDINRFDIPCDTIIYTVSTEDKLKKDYGNIFFPNPVLPGSEINLKLVGETITMLTLYDVSGRLVSAHNNVSSSITAPERPGIYIVRYRIRDEYYTDKLIVLGH